MRAKELRLVVTFHTTVEAMAAERFCKEQGISGRLIPVPRQLSAGCGLAWSAPVLESARLREQLEKGRICWEGWQELNI